jgi:general L-amino acid transport system permease protein
MATLYQNIQAWARQRQIHFDPGRFFAEQITHSWLLTAWLILLTWITVRVTLAQWQAAPLSTALIVAVWLLTLAMAVTGELTHAHSPLSLWLKNSLYNSITNVQITLILMLLIVAGLRAFYLYAWVNASFSTDPALVNELNLQGAKWGAVLANMRNFLVFRFPRAETWRIWTLIAILIGLAVPSLILFSSRFRAYRFTRRLLTLLWLLTPLAGYVLLYGVGTVFSLQQWHYVLFIATPIVVAASLTLNRWLPAREREAVGITILRNLIALAGMLLVLVSIFAVARLILAASGFFPVINVDVAWGGLMLTLIIAAFAIVVSFPMGLLLALGRRSQIPGIPAWLTFGTAVVLVALGLIFITPDSLAVARSPLERVMAFWPLLILLVAYAFQRSFHGNVVAAFSTLYIEIVRGVPLITVLFTANILFNIFLPSELQLLRTTRVLWAVAFFSAAYLAENVRGGLQSIPKGQYEAADSLGLSTFAKYRLIILPQALRAVIPAIVGQFIALFKDTSLVAIIGLFDLLGVANSIAAQPQWLGVRREAYIFVILVYFIGSAIMASYSRRLERRLGVGER